MTISKDKHTLGAFLVITAIVMSFFFVKKSKENSIVEEKERKLLVKKENIRKDSFHLHMAQSSSFIGVHKTNEAENELNLALSFARTDSEIESINNKRLELYSSTVDYLIKKRRYKQAIQELEKANAIDNNNEELIYMRALCKTKIGKTKDAVQELKYLIQRGHSKANELHEKINPLRKRVSYYQTLCCDGTTSNARGRGACSHHGGVCNWNDPVYSEYRKY